MAALEMYEGKNQSNSTTFSSFTAPIEPFVMRQSFIFPLPMYTMATTITEKGIATKDILSKCYEQCVDISGFYHKFTNNIK